MKIISFILAFILLFSPVSTFAQYGGGGTPIGGGNEDNNPKYSVTISGDSITINIDSAKKGNTLDIKVGNSTNGVFKIKFTLGADVTNAKIIVSKIGFGQLFNELPGKPIAAFGLILVNISYEQILNFSFSFKIKKSQTGDKDEKKEDKENRKYKAYSSNSPWKEAGLSQDSSSNSENDEVSFTGSTAIGFKQYALTSETVVARTGDVAGVKETKTESKPKLDSADIIRTGGVDLIRTGGLNNSQVVSTVLTVLALLSFSFVLIRSNQKR
jgi:hypothetical protein